MSTHPLERVTVPVPIARAGRDSSSPCGRAAYAAPICTSPKEICRFTGRMSYPDTKWSPKSWRWAQTPARNSQSVIASASPGCEIPVASASSVSADQENLCPRSRYTGWDADGGYAEFATVPAAFAHPLPAGYTDNELAPLLCAGIIGYRSLLRSRPADRRAARDLRIRRQRTHHRSSGAGARCRGACDDPGCGRPRVGARARRGLGPGRRRDRHR